MNDQGGETQDLFAAYGQRLGRLGRLRLRYGIAHSLAGSHVKACIRILTPKRIKVWRMTRRTQ